jgi:nucleoside-diphosphate-sugar epimerase
MIISITGGSGFIGKLLVASHLQGGDEVRVLSRHKDGEINGVRYFQSDLTKSDCDLYDFVEGAEILYHCAGEINDESLMRKLHVDGTKQLVHASQGQVGRWVQLSSTGVYGPYRFGVVTEKSPERPSGVYEQTKAEADKIVKRSGIPYVILRPSNVFGQTMHNQSLFQFLDMLRKGFFFYIGEVGALVNYVNVKDVVDASVMCGIDDRAVGKIYNLSQTIEVEKMVRSFLSGLGIEREPLRLPEWPIRQFARFFGNLNGFPLNVSRVNALTGYASYSSKKIRKELGYVYSSTLMEQFKSLAQ